MLVVGLTEVGLQVKHVHFQGLQMPCKLCMELIRPVRAANIRYYLGIRLRNMYLDPFRCRHNDTYDDALGSIKE